MGLLSRDGVRDHDDGAAPSSPWRRPSLLARISLALLAVGLLPLAVVSFRLVGSSRDAMVDQVLRTHVVAASSSAGRVDALIAARRGAAELAAADPALGGDPAAPAATSALAALLRSPSLDLVAASLRDAAGVELVRAQRPELAAAVAEALAAPGGGELEVVSGGGSAWLRFEVPLAGGQGGFLRLLADLAAFRAALEPAELGEEAEMATIDRDGRLLLGPSGALAHFPASLLAVARSGRLAGASRFEDRDGAVLGAYAPLTEASWVVLSRQDAAVAETTARELRRRAAISVALAVALALASTWVARRSIVGPLRELIAAQRRLAGPGVRRAAGGEIAELQSGLAELERRLRDRAALDRVFLGRYQVLAVVGEGAMGTVFRGWDPALERPVALKTVRLDRVLPAERREMAARLRGEAVTVARFNHPHIVALYDLQESEDVAFLAMEYVDGQSLERHLLGCERLGPGEAVAIGLGVARGLEAAHARQVVHRDVKPANVLLGRDGAIKVVDFGISELLTSRVVAGAAVFGTPGFVPPEALRGERHGPAGDLFALGVTLYRMLTGSLPFQGRTAAELVLSTMGDPATPPGDAVAGIPLELDALVLELLAKEPARRSPSAGVVVARLEALAATLGARWSPPGSDAPAELELVPTALLGRSQWIAPAGGES